jgi:hypothetical protein
VPFVCAFFVFLTLVVFADPFGHSATQVRRPRVSAISHILCLAMTSWFCEVQAALLSAEVGFDSLWFARLDYQDRATRLADKTMQFIWRPSVSLGPSAQVLTGAFITGYGPPDGFCYDQSCSDPPIQDDTRLYDYNVEDRVNLFVNRCVLRGMFDVRLSVVTRWSEGCGCGRSLTDAASSATNNVMFLMGYVLLVIGNRMSHPR